jgi:hypothetical protein
VHGVHARIIAARQKTHLPVRQARFRKSLDKSSCENRRGRAGWAVHNDFKRLLQNLPRRIEFSTSVMF